MKAMSGIFVTFPETRTGIDRPGPICRENLNQPVAFTQPRGPWICTAAPKRRTTEMRDALKAARCQPFCSDSRIRDDSGTPDAMHSAEPNLNKEVSNMPRGDGTGPQGQGPMSGKGAGACRGDMNRNPNEGQPRSRGIGRGQGLGRRMTNSLGNLRQRLRGRKSGRGRGRNPA